MTVRGKPMFAPRLQRHRSRPRWTVRTVVPATAAGTARTTFTLALAALGLVSAVGSFGMPWSSLSATLVLALLARACLIAARRSPDKRFSWLLSASVATGLAIADLCDLVNAAAVLLTGIAALLLAVRGRAGAS